MKKLFKLLFVFGIMTSVVSCSEDDESGAGPSVTAPSASSVETEGTIELSFDYTAEGGFASSSVVATGGTATITTDGTVGETSGTITVSFVAGTSVGAGSVLLTVIDANGSIDDATVVLTVNDGFTVLVTSNIEADVTWVTGKTYILGGRITVLAGNTLTIEPGVVIKGQAGTDANATALLVARDATLMAAGTAALPIIFTSVADEITPEDVAAGDYSSPNLNENISGLWGGVIILGNAPISASVLSDPNDEDSEKIDVSEIQIEGIPTSDTNGLYGGSDAADNSGVLQYISIRHGGTNIGAGNEINGLSLGGVGSGTTIDHIEIVSNQDDGIEFFGGRVNVSDVVIWNSNDDGLDTDQDWTGTCSNFIIMSPIGGSAFELDGPEGSAATQSGGTATFTNGIVYAGGSIDHLVDWDDNTNNEIQNVYFFGMEDDYTIAESASVPVETFNGDGSGTSSGWETTSATGVTAADVFGTITITEVAAGANTVGPDASEFGWSWAGHSGQLTSIGL